MLTQLLFAVLLHPIHATHAEMEWNQESQRVEVALRLDPIDEQKIDRLGRHLEAQASVSKPPSNQRTSHPMTSEKGRQKETPTIRRHLALLAAEFQFSSPSLAQLDRQKTTKWKGHPVPVANYRWIGREEKDGFVWWYFEIQPADGRKPTRLRQTLLFQTDRRYRHTVLILGEKKRLSLEFSPEVDQQTIPW
ncbi:MAG: hypothetical protein AAF989_10080 [Planctomycetota bacterium]